MFNWFKKKKEYTRILYINDHLATVNQNSWDEGYATGQSVMVATWDHATKNLSGQSFHKVFVSYVTLIDHAEDLTSLGYGVFHRILKGGSIEILREGYDVNKGLQTKPTCSNYLTPKTPNPYTPDWKILKQ